MGAAKVNPRVQGVLSQSAGRRFIKKFGMALVWAALVGSAVGPLVYFRASRPTVAEDESSIPLHRQLVRQLETLELIAYDWRMRELALSSSRPEDVVVVAIDDETVANARLSEQPELAVQPWPRALLGGLVKQLFTEGAAHVVIDLPLTELSAHHDASASDVTADDERFRELLDAHPAKTTIGFSWEMSSPPPVASQLRPWKVKLAEAQSPEEVRAAIRRILSTRRPAFAIPWGAVTEVWAGVGTEEEGRSLARAWDRKNVVVEEFSAADRTYQWSPLDLLVSLAEVTVNGADLEGMPAPRSIQPPVAPLLTSGSAWGHSMPLRDVDAKIRALPHLIRYTTPDGKEHLLPSVSLAAAMQLKGSRALEIAGGTLFIGGAASVPVDKSGAALVKFDAPEVTRDPRGTLKRSITAWRVIVNLLQSRKGLPQQYDNALKGRTVILAHTAGGADRTFNTAVGRLTGDAGLWGQSIANLVSGQGIRRATPRQDLTLTYLLAFVGSFLALMFTGLFRSFWGVVLYVVILIGTVAAFLLFARNAFVTDRLWMSVAGPLLAMAASFGLTGLYAFRTDRDVRDFVTGVLGRYVSPEVARQVLRDLTLVRPERRQLTVYFADIDGFTKLSEELPPQKLAQLLSEFFTAATDVIRASAGQVDKYIGDGLMAFWGAPIRTDRHAAIACETALKLQEVLASRQPDWEKRFGAKIYFRAGLNTGEVVVGDLGSFLKSTYTVLGGPVNVASTLEKLNRKLNTRSLVGEETMKQAGDGFVFREVARVVARGGKGDPVKVFELVCRKKDSHKELEETLAAFQSALDLYRNRDFAAALAAFDAIKAKDPVALVYADKCETLVKHPELAAFDTGLGV